MSQTTAAPTRTFGYFLDGNWSTSGREAVVSSPYDHSPVAVVTDSGAALVSANPDSR